MKEQSYIGRIQNTGAQKIDAPVADKARKSNGKVQTGSDLRGGK